MNSRKLIYSGLALAGVFCLVRAGSGEVPLESVPNVDLSRYTGRWYEIARYPNRFERTSRRAIPSVLTARLA
jgi:apolipoprotein D and lipocalin family protein